MNEKIKELYDECTSSVYVKTDGYGNDHYRGVTDYQEFAELIIQECCNICEGLQDSLDRQNWPTPYECASSIKEHFGIE